MERELKPIQAPPFQHHQHVEHLDEQGTRNKDDHRPLLKSHSSNSMSSPTSPASPIALPAVPVTPAELEEMEKKYAAYVRHDAYGPMGLGELSVGQKVRLGFALFTLLPIRVILSMSILVVYYLICKVCTLFKPPNREEGDDQQEDYAHMTGWRREVIIRSGRLLSRSLLFVLGFYWIPESYRDLPKSEKRPNETGTKDQSDVHGRPGVIISNHVSYLDILYHMSSSFPSFVAKRSVSKLPFVGLISKCLGCVFVQRESKSSDFKGVAGVVTERIKEAYENDHAPLMMLFPEGTTTNGNFLLPFKSGAFLAKAPVLPVILRYPYQGFSPAWDSISGVRHVILLFCQFINFLEVTRLPVYYPSKEEMDDPKLFANNVRKLMATEGNLMLSDIGLPEKRIYHAALNGFLGQR